VVARRGGFFGIGGRFIRGAVVFALNTYMSFRVLLLCSRYNGLQADTIEPAFD